MAAIGEKQVRWVAELSRLKLTDDEVCRFGTELSAILGYFERLANVDTSRVSAMSRLPVAVGALRADEPLALLGAEAVLANAADHYEGHFRVPKVLDPSGA